jgi:hypothetical protein
VHLDMWRGILSFYKNRRPLGKYFLWVINHCSQQILLLCLLHRCWLHWFEGKSSLPYGVIDSCTHQYAAYPSVLLPNLPPVPVLSSPAGNHSFRSRRVAWAEASSRPAGFPHQQPQLVAPAQWTLGSNRAQTPMVTQIRV